MSLHSVAKYLAGRGLKPPYPPDLRWNPAVKHSATKRLYPCMVAAYRDVSGAIQGVHRTYVTSDGQKLSLPNAKARMMLGDVSGCSIRLGEYHNVLGYTESIEDALSVTALYGEPCWAAGSTAHLILINPPKDVQHIKIFADGDIAGITAAREAATRLQSESYTVSIVMPPEPFKDFNEVLLNQKEKATHESAAESNYIC